MALIKRARWRLLSGSEVVDEPENQDPTLLDPSQARDRRTKRGVGDENQDVIEKEVVSVTKKNYSEKFQRASFSAVALQPVFNPNSNSRKKSKEKKRKEKEIPMGQDTIQKATSQRSNT